MEPKKYFNTTITEEEYSILEPSNKRYYKKNYKYSPALYQDRENEEENLDFMFQEDK